MRRCRWTCDLRYIPRLIYRLALCVFDLYNFLSDLSIKTSWKVMPMRTGSYSFVPLEKISWGVPAVEALPREIEQRRAARVFIVASGTLSRKTQVIDRV